jgi:hypothetical protein
VSTHQVIVKGNRFQAARAAADRGIPFAFVTEWKGYTIGRVGDQHLESVSDWFCEPSITGEPFPVGTCLHYCLTPEAETSPCVR